MKNLAHKIADNVEVAVKKNIYKKKIGRVTRIGAYGSPTKLIDEIAENTAIETIKKSKLNFNILSEECGFINNKSEKTIILDPIDGSFNAVNGIPFYSISIAFGREKISDIEYGLVRNLVNGDTFEAWKHNGAFFNGNRIHVKSLGKATTFSIYLGNKTTKESYKIAMIPRRVRTLGSVSLEICLVAKGSLDISYYVNKERKRRLRVVDIASSVLILREAGGEVYNENFEKIDIGINLNERTNVIAVGDEKLLEVIK